MNGGGFGFLRVTSRVLKLWNRDGRGRLGRRDAVGILGVGYVALTRLQLSAAFSLPTAENRVC